MLGSNVNQLVRGGVALLPRGVAGCDFERREDAVKFGGVDLPSAGFVAGGGYLAGFDVAQDG
jgi:hypothetical protein